MVSISPFLARTLITRGFWCIVCKYNCLMFMYAATDTIAFQINNVSLILPSFVMIADKKIISFGDMFLMTADVTSREAVHPRV